MEGDQDDRVVDHDAGQAEEAEHRQDGEVDAQQPGAEDGADQHERVLCRSGSFISPDLEDEARSPKAVRIPWPARSRFEQSGAEEQALLTEGYRPGLERLGYSL